MCEPNSPGVVDHKEAFDHHLVARVSEPGRYLPVRFLSVLGRVT